MPVGCRARACVRSETPCCARMLSCDEFLAAWLRTPGVVVRVFCASAGLRRRRLCAVPRSGRSVRSARHQVLHVKCAQCPRFDSVNCSLTRCVAPPVRARRRHLATHRRPGDPPWDRSIGHGRAGPRVYAACRWRIKNVARSIMAPCVIIEIINLFSNLFNFFTIFSSEPGRSARPRT